jgi:Cu-processing system permease protein
VRQLLRVAADLLHEASQRRWVLGLFGSITLVLLALALSLQLDVIDGALAGSKLFGALLFDDIVSANRMLGALFTATAYVSFYGGALFLAIACSDFAPELLAPGRIEHLLSLPVTRWQLLLGTFLGVVVLAGSGTLYGALGLTALLGVKTGEWSAGLVIASAVGWAGFCAIYAVMLSANLFVRSAALSGALGILTVILGVVASHREAIAAALEPGLGRALFGWLVLPLPRLGTLAKVSAQLAASAPVDGAALARLLGGCFLFSAALLAVAAWRFDRKEF